MAVKTGKGSVSLRCEIVDLRSCLTTPLEAFLQASVVLRFLGLLMTQEMREASEHLALRCWKYNLRNRELFLPPLHRSCQEEQDPFTGGAEGGGVPRIGPRLGGLAVGAHRSSIESKLSVCREARFAERNRLTHDSSSSSPFPAPGVHSSPHKRCAGFCPDPALGPVPPNQGSALRADMHGAGGQSRGSHHL